MRSSFQEVVYHYRVVLISSASKLLANTGQPMLSRIETLKELMFATARSLCPSSLKSPIATEAGLYPATKFVAAPKVPIPVPSRIETLFEPKFATARSLRPSPLKSPIAIENGSDPAVKFVAAPNVPGPALSRIETLFDAMFAMARSLCPSPSQSS